MSRLKRRGIAQKVLIFIDADKDDYYSLLLFTLK